jgi:hypothetical protein
MNACKPRLARAIQLALGGALGLSAALSASVAFAQQQAADSKELEEIYVTGSRIARGSDFENPSPVVSFSKDDLEKTGYATL